jgi:hypothetical protein
LSGSGIRGIKRMLSDVVAGAALLISGYNLWQTMLKRADLRIFVPPVIEYSSPYQNSNIEVFAIPLTLVNEGAQSGTVLAIELEVTDARTQAVKRFYAANFGRWTMEKTRSNAYQPFAPISLAGHGRQTETVVFLTRGEGEKPAQLVHDTGTYAFKLVLDDGSQTSRRRPSVEFVRELRWYDARAFNEGTLPMFAPDWRSAVNA